MMKPTPILTRQAMPVSAVRAYGRVIYVGITPITTNKKPNAAKIMQMAEDSNHCVRDALQALDLALMTRVVSEQASPKIAEAVVQAEAPVGGEPVFVDEY